MRSALFAADWWHSNVDMTPPLLRPRTILFLRRTTGRGRLGGQPVRVEGRVAGPQGVPATSRVGLGLAVPTSSRSGTRGRPRLTARHEEGEGHGGKPEARNASFIEQVPKPNNCSQ
ncbi:unnamed protein product [Calypogeia fissa]